MGVCARVDSLVLMILFVWLAFHIENWCWWVRGLPKSHIRASVVVSVILVKVNLRWGIAVLRRSFSTSLSISSELICIMCELLYYKRAGKFLRYGPRRGTEIRPQ